MHQICFFLDVRCIWLIILSNIKYTLAWWEISPSVSTHQIGLKLLKTATKFHFSLPMKTESPICRVLGFDLTNGKWSAICCCFFLRFHRYVRLILEEETSMSLFFFFSICFINGLQNWTSKSISETYATNLLLPPVRFTAAIDSRVIGWGWY